MLQGELSAILSTIKVPFVIKIFLLSIFEWPFNTGFTVFHQKSADLDSHCFGKQVLNFEKVIHIVHSLGRKQYRV